MTIFSSGISMYALAKLLELVLGWNFTPASCSPALIVLAYIFLGGLTSAIYNEVLQFFLIVLGFLPLVLLGLKDVGGWSGLTAKLATVATEAGLRARGLDRILASYGSAVGQPDGGRVVRAGHGARLRALLRLLVHRLPGGPARDGGRIDVAPRGGRRCIAAVPKMFFPFLVILPGMIAIALTSHAGVSGFSLPIGADGTPTYDLAIPCMLGALLPHRHCWASVLPP